MAAECASEKICRFCLGDDDTAENPLIAPCQCSGTQKYIHRQCLDEWRVKSVNPKAVFECTLCSTAFKMQHPDDGKERGSWKRRLTSYLGLLLSGFCAIGVVMQLPSSLEVLPLAAVLFAGTVNAAGALGLLLAISHCSNRVVESVVRLGLHMVCPRRSSGTVRSNIACPQRSSGRAERGTLQHLVTLARGCLGAVVCVMALVLMFWVALGRMVRTMLGIAEGIYRAVCEGWHAPEGAACGADEQARRKEVQNHIVMNLEAPAEAVAHSLQCGGSRGGCAVRR